MRNDNIDLPSKQLNLNSPRKSPAVSFDFQLYTDGLELGGIIRSLTVVHDGRRVVAASGNDVVVVLLGHGANGDRYLQ